MTEQVTPDPVVVDVIREFKAALLSAEKAQMEEMTKRWLEIEFTLNTLIDDLAREIELAELRGDPIKTSQIVNLNRYGELLAQVENEVDRYIDYAEGLITKNQYQWGSLGIQNAGDAIRSSFEAFGKLSVGFDILPINAIEFMVGNLGNGSPLNQLLKLAIPDAIEGLTNALINAITLGLNPRETARMMRDGFGLGLNRALNIARTEQLRVYRESSRFQYAFSGLVRGYKRVATHDSRVCAACILAEGRIYELEQHFEEHPQGRCALIPLLHGLPDVEWDSGQDWFRKQPDPYQIDILGPGRYNLWKNGDITLDDIIERKINKTWGNSLNPKPLYKLLGYRSSDAMYKALKVG